MSQSLTVPAQSVVASKPRLIRRVVGLFHGGLQELGSPKERRNPYLDGLRAIAVLLVINGHVADAIRHNLGGNRYTEFTLVDNGWIGVDLFFVLSGYFIGGQLWRELDKTGAIAFGKFVIRRGLRIWPLYFFVFAAIALFWHQQLIDKHYGWSDLVFLTNYLPYGIVLGGWSLCSEEQFYLLTPLLLLLFGRQTLRRYTIGLLAIFVLEYLVRAATYYVHAGHHLFVRSPAAFEVIYYRFHTHCDGLIAGLFVANLTGRRALKTPARHPWIFVLLGAVFLVAAKRIQPETLDFTGLAVFFGALVWWGTQRNIRLFDSLIFYWLSRLSFGMYLLHPYLISPIVRHISPAIAARIGGEGSAFVSFGVLSLAAALISVLTFCLVEHPFLVLRTALLRRTSTPSLVAT
jgi:peptidoglycan/LPS O-acetylase OafA/YrhL